MIQFDNQFRTTTSDFEDFEDGQSLFARVFCSPAKRIFFVHFRISNFRSYGKPLRQRIIYLLFFSRFFKIILVEII